ncbi:MAG: type VI secretion system contractile sheath large subunit, partial [Planctomycetota bacterium]
MTDTATPSADGATATLAPLSSDEFSELLSKEFKPRSDGAKEAIENAVQTLAEQLLADTVVVSDDALKTIESLVAEIDNKLGEQINEIIHHDDFRELEGAWRGLHYLVNNTETDEMLKIRVMNISKPEMHKTLKKFKGTNWDQSPLFKKLYEEEYGQFGGEPYGCLVGDYHFAHTPVDVEMLREISKISAASHTPFISGASPTLMQMET